MLTSLALIFLVALSAASICKKLRLPRIIGMLFSGIVMGPYALDLLDPSILGISSELRRMALVVILIKAGLALNLNDLKRVGRPALMMSFLPALFEIFAYTLFAPIIFHITIIDAAVIGAVLSAVSPAVVVPKMVSLMETRYGTDKSIPQLILAGASLDDVFVIVLFSTFCGMAQGASVSVSAFAGIPISIILGVAVGAVCGLLLYLFFERCFKNGSCIRNSTKVIILLSISFLMLTLEDKLSGVMPFSGLLAIMGISCMLAAKSTPSVTKRLSEKFGKLWIAAEVVLFVLVGAAVDIRYTLNAGLPAILMIFIALIFRSAGVILCMTGTNLSIKERLFCVIAYLPKATVQAAIGSVPLALGLNCGTLCLSIAVLAIIITAPLGAFGMDITYKALLNHEQ